MTVLNLSVDDLFLRSNLVDGGHVMSLGQGGVLPGVGSSVVVVDQEGDPTDWLLQPFTRVDRGGVVALQSGPQEQEGVRPFLFTGVYDASGLLLASRTRLYAPPERLAAEYWPSVLAAGYLPYSASGNEQGASLQPGVNALLAVDPDWAYSPDGVHLFACGTGQAIPYGAGVWVDLEEVLSQHYLSTHSEV